MGVAIVMASQASEHTRSVTCDFIILDDFLGDQHL